MEAQKPWVAVTADDADTLLAFLDEVREIFNSLPEHVECAWKRIDKITHPYEDAEE